MGYQIPGKTITLVAAEEIARYKAVVVTSTGKVEVAGAGVAIAGIAQLPDSVDHAIPLMIDGVSQVIYGGVVTAGDNLSTDVNGDMVKATADVFDGTGLHTTRGSKVVGIALQSGTDNVLGTMLLK